MDPLPTQCVLLGSEPATMDSAKSDVHGIRLQRYVKVKFLLFPLFPIVRSNQLLFSSPIPQISRSPVRFTFHHVCAAKHRAL
jgi:hypothetical protein